MTKKRKYESADLGKATLYQFYKEEGGMVDKTKYNKVVKEFFTGLIELIVFDNLWFKMPHGLGTIRIQEKEVVQKIVDGKVVHNMRMDFNATRKLWDKDPKAKEEGRRIYHLNEHTDGFAYKIKWDKPVDDRNIPFRIRGIWGYTFKANRNFGHLLTKNLKDPERKTQYFR